MFSGVLNRILGLLIFGLILELGFAYKRHPYEGTCDDVAIIGAGVAGTYAGWRLRNQLKKITIYEFSSRVGGRMYTKRCPDIPDINIELGAMRFYPETHRLLHQTIQQLGLPIVDFPLGSGKSPDTLIYLRGVHLRNNELGGYKTPYRLLPHERKPDDQLQREMYYNNTDVLTTDVAEGALRYFVKTLDGIDLYKQSSQSVYHKSVSTEAQKYITEAGPFRFFKRDGSASMDFDESPLLNSTSVVRTVKTGFNSIPEALLKQFLQSSIRHQLKLNLNLKAIKKRLDGAFIMSFEPTRTINGRTRVLKNRPIVKKCAKKIILAINRLALERLDWYALYQPRIREYLTEAVKDSSAAKYFLSYDYPWWRRSPVYAEFGVSDTPLRQTYDFGTSEFSQRSVLMPMYIDDEGVSTWLELAERTNKDITDGDIAFTIGKETVFITHKYLSALYKIDARTIPQPTGSILAIWRNYPYGGAWQKWMPGYFWPHVERAMVKPLRTDNIFVVCNAFNSRTPSYWSESALQSVESVMPYFGLREIVL